MADYISREAVINITAETGAWETQNRVRDLPAADVQPVKHGRWECVGHDDTTYWYRCSVCGHEEHDNMTKHDNCCCSCGARMDLDSVTHDRCSNYMDCDGNCFIDDTPCDCNGNIEKCKGR